MNLVNTVTIISNINTNFHIWSYIPLLPVMYFPLLAKVLYITSAHVQHKYQHNIYLLLPIYYLILHQPKFFQSAKFYNICCCIDKTE